MKLPENTLPACVGKHDLFDSTRPADHAEAAAICNGCPFADQCRDRFEETVALWGYDKLTGPRGTWGGRLASPENVVDPAAEFTEHARDLNRQRAISFKHGTEAGYRRHRRAGEEPCVACRKGATAARAARAA